jgi:hypothetical protein
VLQEWLEGSETRNWKFENRYEARGGARVLDEPVAILSKKAAIFAPEPLGIFDRWAQDDRKDGRGRQVAEAKR